LDVLPEWQQLDLAQLRGTLLVAGAPEEGMMEQGKGEPMEGIREKFTIRITDNGVAIVSGEGERLRFTAPEALMLLDILRNEQAKLKKMAEEASPIPIKFKV
jgi:hypothetical protein